MPERNRSYVLILRSVNPDPGNEKRGCSGPRDRVPDMDTNTDPPHVPESAKRYQIMLRDRAGQVTIDIADTVEHTGVTMPLADALNVADVIGAVALRYFQQRAGGRALTLENL